MSEHVAEWLTYQQSQRMNPVEALRLGVSGHDPRAQQEREARAQYVLADFDRIQERVYAEARGLEDPSLPEPIAARLLVDHCGDAQAACGDERFRDLVMVHENFQAGEVFLNDEDGTRYEWSNPLGDPENLKYLNEKVAEARAVMNLWASTSHY